MKYLDYPLLNHLSSTLSSSPHLETKVNVRFEAYSVKPIRKERGMFNKMEEAYISGQEEMEELSFSPEMKEAGLSSCFGRLDEKESRKVHFLLVSTLNAAFPGHDFSSLRPDHFTREPNSGVVLSHLNSLLGRNTHGSPVLAATSSPLLRPTSLSSSPALPPSLGAKTDLYRPLSEVVELDECEVYSWFPSPEYDPHADVEDDGSSAGDGGYGFNEDDEEEMGGDDRMDLDEMETEASWGQAGMELDVEPLAGGGVMERSKRRGSEAVGMTKRGSEDERRGGGLLWTVNYFFYSKRQKRLLFITCWCRKRPVFLLSPNPTESAFPAPISSSFTPPSAMSSLPHRNRVRHRARPLGRPPKKITKQPSKGDMSSLIPIRQTPAPTPGPSGPISTGRLASSAPNPSAYLTPAHSGMSPHATQAALARMTQGGFKARPSARTTIATAARASNIAPVATPGSGSGQGQGQSRSMVAGISSEGEGRTRKERSESGSIGGAGSGGGNATGTSSRIQAALEGAIAPDGKGKRVKV